MRPEPLTRLRVLLAVGVGLIGAFFIWTVVPLNNYLLNNNLISDSYMPEIALALLALVALGFNPLLGAFRSAWRMTRRQLALILGIWLVACVIPGGGLLGIFPYSLAQATRSANVDGAMAEMHEAMSLSPSLFLDELEMGKETPVADGFLEQLEPGQPIPWRQWIRPVSAWLPLILGSWLMMIGMGMIVYPQWRDRERLSFPLVTMYEALMEPPEEGRRVPPVFRNRIFWAGALVVLALHSFNGLSNVTSGGFPRFPLSWNLWPIFQDGMLRNAPWTLRGGRIFFSLIGIVYFMPNRVSFSIWFSIIVFAVYLMVKWTYFPMAGLAGTSELDFKTGAWFAYALAILWLGRAHWAEVGRAMFSRGPDETTVRDRSAGWLFTAGLAAMFLWFKWVGLSTGVSIGYVVVGTLLTLLVSRVVCEAGLPLMNFSPLLPFKFISMFPLKWWSASAIFIGGFVGILFNYGARICAAVMCCLSMGVDRERTPREQMRVSYLLLAVLVLGVFVAGAVHLSMAYRNEISLDGWSSLGGWGSQRVNDAMAAAKQFHAGATFTPPASRRWPAFISGIVVASGIQTGCMAFPRWPIHPIAFLFVGSFIGDAIWPSIFFGWLIKSQTIRYCGASGYRKAQPLFIGLVLGEIFAVILWTLVPVIQLLCGVDPSEIGRTTILMSR